MDTLFTKIGPERLQEVVNRFYNLVFEESSIAHLFQTDRQIVREKQYMFLTQFLGGPQLYTEKYGHPRMRARHLPHAIGQAEKEEWLRCMRQAIDSMEFEDDLGEALYQCFPTVAQHMVNR
jgi:hemoglobin